MAYNNYVVISNTGAIGGGYKIQVKYDSWKRSKPAYESYIGLNADSFINIGAANAKWVWEFVAQVNVTPLTGYCSLAQLEIYATSLTASLRTLQFQDVYGTLFSAVWNGAYQPLPTAGDTYGSSELYEVGVKLLQQ